MENYSNKKSKKHHKNNYNNNKNNHYNNNNDYNSNNYNYYNNYNQNYDNNYNQSYNNNYDNYNKNYNNYYGHNEYQNNKNYNNSYNNYSNKNYNYNDNDNYYKNNQNNQNKKKNNRNKNKENYNNDYLYNNLNEKEQFNSKKENNINKIEQNDLNENKKKQTSKKNISNNENQKEKDSNINEENETKKTNEIAQQNEFSIYYSNIIPLKNSLLKPIKELINDPVYKNIFSIEKFKEKFFQCFDINEIKDDLFFDKLLSIFENNKIVNEICVINFMKSIQIINNENIILKNNEENKKKAIDYFLNKVINFYIISPYDFYENFLECFQIKDELFKHFQLMKEEDLKNYFKDRNNSIYFVKYFKIQNNYSFKNFKIVEDKTSLIINLYSVYNSSKQELLDLNDYILPKIPKKSIHFQDLNRIFNGNQYFTQDIKKTFVNNYMKEITGNEKDPLYSKFCSFIFKNNLEMCIDFFNKKNFLEDLVYKLNYIESAMAIIKTYTPEKKKSLNKSLLTKILNSLNFENISDIKLILELIPEEINQVINDYLDDHNTKNLKQLIKLMKIEDKLNESQCSEIEKTNIRGFFYNRVGKFLDNQIDVLVELVNDQNEFDIFLPIVLKELKGEKKNEKLSYILSYAKSNGLLIPDFNKKTNKLIQKALNTEPLEIQKDFFGPRTKDCISFTREEIKVIFVNLCSDLVKYFSLYFKDTEFIGIDSEWKETLKIKQKTKTAIIQLSDYDGKNVLILDMIALYKDKSFEKTFIDLFKNKKFISFGFESDLINMSKEIEDFFKEQVQMYDIEKLYQVKYFEKAPSFSKVCEKVLGKNLCKYEQCSNWEKRPLRESQLHYAALDAIICCLIFKKLNEK